MLLLKPHHAFPTIRFEQSLVSEPVEDPTAVFQHVFLVINDEDSLLRHGSRLQSSLPRESEAG